MLIDILNIKKINLSKQKHIYTTTIQTDKHINNHIQNNKKLQRKQKKNTKHTYTLF